MSTLLILFDFDGVLADTLHDLLQFGQEACDELGIQHTVVQADVSELEVMSFATFGRACEVPEALVNDFVRLCLDKIAAKEFPPSIFVGLADVIRKLSARHVLGIVTTNSSQNVKAFLARHGLDDCFRVIHGVDTPGSKVEKISRSKEQFAAENEAVFMIGDAASDIKSAREAGVRSVAVSWGHQSLQRLGRENPDFVVHSPEELFDLFEGDKTLL
jgi:phosphoglycolate phosphatase